jgi:putative oxidoreductase
MSRLTDIVTLRTVQLGPDAGLLCLRLLAGVSLFVKHGWEKPTNFAEMAQHFPNPVGLGPVPSLVIALLADAICSVLVAVGLATRWAALFAAANIFVAWSLVHHFEYLGHVQGADHGEVCVLYIIIFVSIALAGPGRFSVDAKLP